MTVIEKGEVATSVIVNCPKKEPGSAPRNTTNLNKGIKKKEKYSSENLLVSTQSTKVSNFGWTMLVCPPSDFLDDPAVPSFQKAHPADSKCMALLKVCRLFSKKKKRVRPKKVSWEGVMHIRTLLVLLLLWWAILGDNWSSTT